ncbi:MAG: transposase, partial [Planctomycetota bacterium]|nr:transposase [Planctomycetota bacterium]
MYIRRPKWKSQNGKTYQSAWLRESYREAGKSKTRHLLNLGDYSESTLNALEYALKHIPELARMSKLDSRTGKPDFRQRQGKSLGAVWAVKRVAEELDIVRALGSGRQARLALWRIIARVIDQGSRLSAVRPHDLHARAETVGLEEGFSEDGLYVNLARLSQHQGQIEASLFRKRRKEGGSNLYLHDVTSSYPEGEENAFAAYGYNRDRKKGKKRIMAGLLADAQGDPVSVEAFRGNTLDFQTLAPRIKKTAERFGCREVTFVGDRGMIKSGQIEDLNRHGFHYITALNK